MLRKYWNIVLFVVYFTSLHLYVNWYPVQVNAIIQLIINILFLVYFIKNKDRRCSKIRKGYFYILIFAALGLLFYTCNLFIHGVFEQLLTPITLLSSYNGIFMLSIFFVFSDSNYFFKYIKFYINCVLFLLLFYVLPFNYSAIPILCEFAIPLLLILPYIKKKKYKRIISILSILVFVSTFVRILWLKSIIGYSIYFMRYWILRKSNKTIFQINCILFCIPFFFFILGITNTFNIFNLTTELGLNDENLSEDTRTFLYKESLNSAFENNYVMIGRTPARGVSSSFQARREYYHLGLKNILYDSIERQSEIQIDNIFTWFGVVGVIGSFFFYFIAMRNAVLKSNNKFMKTLSIYISMLWIMSWIGDPIIFSISSLTNISLLAICYYPSIREMTDGELYIRLNRYLT